MACNGVKMGSKWAHFTCLGTPNGLESVLEKHIFHPIFDPFSVPKQPIFKAFRDFRRAKTGHYELKTRQKPLVLASHVVQDHF